MLAMLEFNNSHNPLYDSKLRHTRNRIDEPIDPSKIKLLNNTMWYPDGHRIQYIVFLTSQLSRFFGFWAIEALNLVRRLQIGRSDGGCVHKCSLGRMPLFHAHEVLLWPVLTFVKVFPKRQPVPR